MCGCVCKMFVDDKADSGWLLFYWQLMLLQVMGAGFNKLLAQLQGNEKFPWLFQDFVKGYVKP